MAQAAFLVLFLLIYTNHANGQSLTSGDIIGRITDPAGAVVPAATVNLKSLDTGSEQSTTTNGEGSYRFSLLKPGRYEVSAAVAGFAKVTSNVAVSIGQSTQVDFALEISKQAETIEVTSESPLISTDPGNATSFTPTEVALLPTAGGDLTTIAFTSPGVVVAPGTGYGNFTANGLPGTSNLFTVNGENDMDPYFNINNSGATNLTLGANEVQEVTVTTNPYSGQYGQLMGAQVSYVTRSGTNEFHGNAQYWWNGRYLNANNWFNNAFQSPRAFANANQWAGAVGGPIIKDKLFFFFDTEGLRFVLPNVYLVTIPTPAFATAVLNNIQATQPTELPVYKQMMGFYAAAAAGKTPTAGDQSPGCGSVALPGWNTGDPCSEQITTSPTALAHEWIIASRIDWKIGSKDDLFFRFKIDHGLQPTYIDPVSSNFDALSNQPAYDYQVQEHHVFNATMTNEFTASLSHYVAQFTQNAAEVNAFPYRITFEDSSAIGNVNFTSFNPASSFPQGRNITQYQFIDNFTWTKGKHNMQFGANFRRYDVSDHNFFYNYPRVYFSSVRGLDNNGMQEFADGIAYRFRQSDNQATDVPIALWGLGVYASDTWKMTPTFTLTAALRIERNSNPVCQKNCFANFTGSGSFSQIASVEAANSGGDPGDVPYSSDIQYNQHQAYKGVDGVVWSPRLAFSWAPGAINHFPYFPGGGKTVISGGVGIFYDNPASGFVDNLLANPPVSVNFRVQPTLGTLPFDPAGGPATFAAASQAFSVTKSYNEISNELKAIGVSFPAPAFEPITGTFHAPQAQEWNLKIDQQLTRTTAISANYAGNHVIRLPFSSSFPNAFDEFGLFPGVAAVPASAVVPNYGIVTNTQSGAVANYNGLTVSVREQSGRWFLAHFNYTYSHTIDEISNGGLVPYQSSSSVSSILQQLNPTSLKAGNYGNAEYDIRNLFSADFVVTPQAHFENKFLKAALGGWQWSGKIFWRTGYPFTVMDGNATLGNFGGTIVGNQIAAVAQVSNCGRASAATSSAAVPCINPNAFTNTGDPSFAGYSAWPQQGRDSFRGPGYFDMDMSLFKTFQFKERVALGIGMTAYNAFNHPNFALPDNTLGDSTFGQQIGMQGVPASPYGNFLGFDSSPRVVQLTAKLTF